jgi:hypothetical protein
VEAWLCECVQRVLRLALPHTACRVVVRDGLHGNKTILNLPQAR